MQIWKYPLKLVSEQAIEVPRGTRFLSAQMQNNQLTLWAKVYADAPVSIAIIYIIGTGQENNKIQHSEYINTVQDGRLVWHIFTDNLSGK